MIWTRPDEIVLRICKYGYCVAVDYNETLNLVGGSELGMGWGYLIIPILVGVIIGFIVGYYMKKQKKKDI